MKQPLKPLFLAGLGGMALTIAAWSGLALAQQGTQDNKAQDNRANANANANAKPDALMLIYPTGDRATSSLLVEAMAPAEVPVGHNFDYTLRVTNLTRNLILEDVAIRQETGEGFSIEKSEPEPEKGEDGQNAWMIGRLEPGQSKTIKVTALGDKEGMAQNCIKVHYEPSLCLATKFTKPTIKVSKTAPKQADICRPLELRYAVKNTGTGVARNITLTDDLPEGLTTQKDSDKVTFDVGDLQPGATREFKVLANAAKTGEFGSRAVAEGEGDLKANSNEVTTKIVQSKLAVNLDGPSAQFVNQPMTYQATIKNEGDAPAPEASLRIDVDENARVLRVSQSDPGKVRPQQSGQTLSWQFGDLEPGGERTVSFTVNTSQKEELKHIAHATSACAAGGDLAKAATDTAELTTALITFPALLLEMVDRNDPVKVGDTEQYDIVVRNQGSGADQNVQIKVDLPDQFEFVSASGATKATADGQTITFEPIDELAPRAKASWTLQLKAKKPGDVRTQVDLSSEYLKSPVPEQEPTRVID